MNDKLFGEDFTTELKHDFLETSTDLLSEFEEILIPLKKKGNIALNDIKEIFRIVHTLKGNSNAVGYNEMGSMFHIFENMLAQLRNEDFSANLKVLDFFFLVLEKSQDAIELYKKDINATIDFSFLEQEIRNFYDDKAATQAKPTKYKIAVIDDEPSIREILVAALEGDFDAEFFEFSDGLEALNAIASTKFDLMAVDYKMPNMDGKDFLKAVRTSENINAKTPVLFISGYNPNVENDKAMLDDIFYIQKPFDTNRIVYYAKCSFLKSAKQR